MYSSRWSATFVCVLHDLADVRVPDVVRGRALDRRPADEAGLGRQRHRRRLPAHVEPERPAPRRRASRRHRAHVRVERVRLAGEPRQHEVHRGRRDPDRRDARRDLAAGRLASSAAALLGGRCREASPRCRTFRSPRRRARSTRTPSCRRTTGSSRARTRSTTRRGPGSRRMPACARTCASAPRSGGARSRAGPSARRGRRRRGGGQNRAEESHGEEGEAGRTHRSLMSARVGSGLSQTLGAQSSCR